MLEWAWTAAVKAFGLQFHFGKNKKTILNFYPGKKAKDNICILCKTAVMTLFTIAKQYGPVTTKFMGKTGNFMMDF